jgi:thioredoxin 2
MHLVCPHCVAVNRVPEERLGDGPICARCKTELAPRHPVALNEAAFPPYVGKSEAPVLVDFWADWCGPCKQMAPQFEAAAAQAPGIRFIKLDTEANPGIAARCSIRSIPTLILFRDGEEIARRSGAMPAADLLRWLQAALA